jgi:hypothetical protein
MQLLLLALRLWVIPPVLFDLLLKPTSTIKSKRIEFQAYNIICRSEKLEANLPSASIVFPSTSCSGLRCHSLRLTTYILGL